MHSHHIVYVKSGKVNLISILCNFPASNAVAVVCITGCPNLPMHAIMHLFVRC